MHYLQGEAHFKQDGMVVVMLFITYMTFYEYVVDGHEAKHSDICVVMLFYICVCLYK